MRTWARQNGSSHLRLHRDARACATGSLFTNCPNRSCVCPIIHLHRCLLCSFSHVPPPAQMLSCLSSGESLSPRACSPQLLQLFLHLLRCCFGCRSDNLCRTVPACSFFSFALTFSFNLPELLNHGTCFVLGYSILHFLIFSLFSFGQTLHHVRR